jgi:glycosyltransferase involved in cell wall biosynthesis
VAADGGRDPRAPLGAIQSEDRHKRPCRAFEAFSFLGPARVPVPDLDRPPFYPLADARIVVAKEAADDLARISGVDRRSLEVVYNPVGEPPADVGTTREIEALWGEAERRIITVGSLKAQKNQQLLIRSFTRAFKGRSVKLMILGQGELRPSLEALAAELGVSDQVLLPGFATDPWSYYASADLFALSSDYEGYPLVLIEALRSGLTIVSTDCESGPREILDGGRYGRLVPVGDEEALSDAMKEALDRPQDSATLRARAETLSGQSTSDRYLELMLGEPNPRLANLGSAG